MTLRLEDPVDWNEAVGDWISTRLYDLARPFRWARKRWQCFRTGHVAASHGLDAGDYVYISGTDGATKTARISSAHSNVLETDLGTLTIGRLSDQCGRCGKRLEGG